MEKIQFSVMMISPGDEGFAYTGTLTFAGDKNGRSIGMTPVKFSGNSQEEVMGKITKAVQNFKPKDEIPPNTKPEQQEI